MKDVTTNGGKIYTDAEWITERGFGDKLVPEFIPTHDDLVLLAYALMKQTCDNAYDVGTGSISCSLLNHYDYVGSRLERVWDFLTPEEIKELEEYRDEEGAKVKADIANFEAAMNAAAPADDELRQKAGF